MKKMVLGAVIGAIIVLFFIFFGGGKYVRKLGVETQHIGKRLEKVEKKMKRSATEAQKKVEETASGVKKKVGSTSEKINKLLD